MYGFVNSALEKLIRRRYGREKWDEISKMSEVYIGLDNTFLINTVYKDADTYALVSAACEVLGLDAGSLLEMFGEQFLVWCRESGYSKTLQLLGRSLQDFLTNLDALHDHLSIIYPRMDAPSFRCSQEVKNQFQLHYYSQRDGLEPIVMGIVKTVAREFYKVEVVVTQVETKNVNGYDHSIFVIKEVAHYEEGERQQTPDNVVDSHSEKQLISAKSFCKAFPFHIIFDRDMHILQVGASLAWVIPNWNHEDVTLKSFFALERPRMRLSFMNVLSHINTIFILRMTAVTASSAAYCESPSDPMRLRGQMIYLPESYSMLFLCSPRVSSIDDLEQRSLYISDIPIHDATRGLLMMSQTAQSEIAHVVQLEELVQQLNVAQCLLEEEKGRMRDLLHEMLPKTVAESLMAGQHVEAERFDSVTILFSDIVGFTTICASCEPIDVVRLLNDLYTYFDQVVGKNGVYKVETIGDAYMVVGGLPERSSTHAECVCNQALDMMYYSKQVKPPKKKDEEEGPIQMRIGIHSGGVVAGIVGSRMPRYCLFGNTVNVASRCESNGVPGKIQVTEDTYKLLKDKPNFQFTPRQEIEFKNVKKPVMCYFLDENTEKGEFLPLENTTENYYSFFAAGSPPPPTPFHTLLTPMGMEGAGFHSLGKHTSLPTLPFPDIQVIDPTPDHSPHTSPSHQKGKFSCPFSSESKDHKKNMKHSSTTPIMNLDRVSPTNNGAGHEEDTNFAIPSYLLQNERSHALLTHKTMSPVREEVDELADNQQHPLRESTLIMAKEDRSHASYESGEERRQKRSVSSDRTDRSESEVRSFTSDDSALSWTDSEDANTSGERNVRYVRPRSSSIKQRVTFFESTSNRNRRSGLPTVNHTQQQISPSVFDQQAERDNCKDGSS